jgi:hypothetical protein
MRGQYSSASGLGVGLSGTRRLMDEFEIETNATEGTRVTVIKWLPPVEAAGIKDRLAPCANTSARTMTNQPSKNSRGRIAILSPSSANSKRSAKNSNDSTGN